MSPEELVEMRQTFERLDTGHKDYSYNVQTREYNCRFTQTRWIDWRAAWVAGQRYKAGKPSTQETLGEKMVRVNRVSRTLVK